MARTWPLPQEIAGAAEDGRTRAVKRETTVQRVLERVLKRRGLADIDPESAAGKEVKFLSDSFASVASPELPASVRMEGVRTAVHSVIMMRSLESQMYELGGVVPPGQTKFAAARRAQFNICVQSYARFVQLLGRGFRMMGVDGFSELKPEGDDELKELLRKIRPEDSAPPPATALTLLPLTAAAQAVSDTTIDLDET